MRPEWSPTFAPDPPPGVGFRTDGRIESTLDSEGSSELLRLDPGTGWQEFGISPCLLLGPVRLALSVSQESTRSQRGAGQRFPGSGQFLRRLRGLATTGIACATCPGDCFDLQPADCGAAQLAADLDFGLSDRVALLEQGSGHYGLTRIGTPHASMRVLFPPWTDGSAHHCFRRSSCPSSKPESSCSTLSDPNSRARSSAWRASSR